MDPAPARPHVDRGQPGRPPQRDPAGLGDSAILARTNWTNTAITRSCRWRSLSPESLRSRLPGSPPSADARERAHGDPRLAATPGHRYGLVPEADSRGVAKNGDEASTHVDTSREIAKSPAAPPRTQAVSIRSPARRRQHGAPGRRHHAWQYTRLKAGIDPNTPAIWSSMGRPEVQSRKRPRC